MLLPFDLRADREGWTVFEIATDRPALRVPPCFDHRIAINRQSGITPERRVSVSFTLIGNNPIGLGNQEGRCEPFRSVRP
jgi:hypothetical protein